MSSTQVSDLLDSCIVRGRGHDLGEVAEPLFEIGGGPSSSSEDRLWGHPARADREMAPQQTQRVLDTSSSPSNQREPAAYAVVSLTRLVYHTARQGAKIFAKFTYAPKDALSARIPTAGDLVRGGSGSLGGGRRLSRWPVR